jgi:hypothetical protein
MTCTNFTWIKNPVATNVFYPAGFTNRTALACSPYTAPGVGTSVLYINVGVINFTGGNLDALIGNQFTWYANNLLTSASTNYNLTLKVTVASGLFNGSFRNPANPAALTPYKGVVLQNDITARGFFKGTNQTGAFLVGQTPGS